jgi:glycosyltransferase involved in cell wall biosynthesis
MSVKRQKVLPDEVVIADDGSGPETSELIEEIRKDFPVPILHVWHADEGFRLAAIRNKGIAASSAEYLIQIDGDLVLHPYFIADHLQFRKPGCFVTGSRVMLSAESTGQMLQHRSINIRKYGSGKTNIANGIRSTWVRNFMAGRYKINGKHRFYVKGCNMAFWKKDLVAVNGYNEMFTGWGREDSEIAIRLINAGVKKQFIKMAAICYHLYHTVASRDLEPRNIALMETAIEQKTVKAADGLDKYLGHP